MFPLLEESVIAVWSFSFHQAWGEKDILVCGVPKLNKVETWEDVRAELNTAAFEIEPLKPLENPVLL